MGNDQSADCQIALEAGLRLSTLCRYLSEAGNDEVLGFPWFQASKDVSGVVLRGAHRWGYVLSHVGGQRLFKDSRQRFLVLLDHFLCYFDSHAPEARMRGSIDLDKSHCHLELLPRVADNPGSIYSGPGPFATENDDDSEEHRVEITRKADGTSMVLCFDTAVSLQDWMKSIFDVQQRKATFSRLRHADDRSRSRSNSNSDSGRNRAKDDDWGWVDVASFQAPQPQPQPRLSVDNRRSADEANHLESLSSPGATGGGRRRRQRQRQRSRRQRGQRASRGSLESPPCSPSSSSRGRVPSCWAVGIESSDPSPEPPPGIGLGKASERLAHLPRGGRAASGDGIDGGSRASLGLDEYGAFTTAHASIYEGWTRGLQPHGWGRMTYANGDCVEGWWEHDILEGSGEYTSREEGWTYRGGYVAGKRHGPGRLVTAQGDVWECEWRHGVVAPGGSGTHATPGGEQYQGGCVPSAENPEVPCRSGHGRLRRRNGEHIETQFRAGRAVDGAKGVVRFRNGAIFFGELRDARPHGYGELYLSSVKPEGRLTRSGSLGELDVMARDVLWYKGEFSRGKAHGTGLVKFKEPPIARRGPLLVVRPRATPSPGALRDAGNVLRNSSGNIATGGGGDTNPSSPAVLAWGESKEEEEEEEEGEERIVVGGGVDVPLALAGTTDEEEDEEDTTDTTDSDDEEEDDNDEDEDRGPREEGRGGERHRAVGSSSSSQSTSGDGQARAAASRPRQRPPAEGAGEAGGDGASLDMDYEMEFVEGVMVRHDPDHLRLAALRFGRAELRRLDALLREEEEAMSRLRSRGLCLLCNSKEMNALLVRCRHRVLCMGCAGRADCCPVCRERIGKVVKTYST